MNYNTTYRIQDEHEIYEFSSQLRREDVIGILNGVYGINNYRIIEEVKIYDM